MRVFNSSGTVFMQSTEYRKFYPESQLDALLDVTLYIYLIS